MFCVNVALGNTCWRLLFKTEEKAKAAFDNLKPLPMNTGTVVVEDDFGQVCSATSGSVHGLMFEDLEKAKMANVELQLYQQRVQSMVTKAIQSDPGLRGGLAMGGPPVLTPMGNGFPRN